MNIRIELLTEKKNEAYEQFMMSIGTSLIYSSLKYQNFLCRILEESQPLYILAFEADTLTGAMPIFLKNNSVYGNVLSSLPFYGSNGGIIINHDALSRTAVAKALLGAFQDFAKEKKVISSTLISNPLEPMKELYGSFFCDALHDERRGGITPLPKCGKNDEIIKESLMAIFHQKTRNAIRKAEKTGVVVRHSNSPEDLKILAEMHWQHIKSIGGISKPWNVFQAISDTFAYDRDYRVYIAEREGAAIAALLVFFYNRTAEYFIPATAEGQRIYQPMSLLVLKAMQEACRRGLQYWNWGGTWSSQKGIYNFKMRWGTQDRPYLYYTQLFDKSICAYSQEKILEEYPYVYVLPFGYLSSPHKVIRDTAAGVSADYKTMHWRISGDDER